MIHNKFILISKLWYISEYEKKYMMATGNITHVDDRPCWQTKPIATLMSTD